MRLGLLLAVVMAAGCAHHLPYALSSADQARFGTSVLRVNVAGHAPMILGLNDCILYRARTAHEDIVGWEVVLASDWGMHSYPKWMTGCTSQHVAYNGRYVVASFCAQALGAGGGCAGGDGTYRSRTADPASWQIEDGSHWLPLAKY
ncbi:MAG TPA: hypothetical protein VKR56_07750 [Candidatus Cybelea sp.]|nr:hypothetical protein [Candidatus Cybelea sp.]